MSTKKTKPALSFWQIWNMSFGFLGIQFGFTTQAEDLESSVKGPDRTRYICNGIYLIAGGLGLISIILFKTPEMLILSMLGIGLAWASILAMPYAILTGSLPAAKMGTYMGIFNFFIVIPQIMAASILGFMVKSLFNGESIYALVTGGISMFIAALLVLFVEDKD
jgi:maltose/moltooligosaccharide transporter